MKRKPTILKIGLIVLFVTALPLARSGIANADYAATPYDYVGLGGDTPQFSADFLANGDANGDLGFNAGGDQRRLVTFDSEADANGRSSYYGTDEGSESSQLQYPTAVLREGEDPTSRASSSGNAIIAFEADTSSDDPSGIENVNFIFSSTALSSSNTTTSDPLHEYEFGTDTVTLAADSTTNAPSGLTATQLAAIYEGHDTTWTQVGGSSGATIVPLLPPSTSAITKSFLSAIGISYTQVDQAVVTTVEQNDPTAITLNSSSANVIVPFSEARYDLLVGSSNWDPSGPGTGSPGPNGPYFPAIPGDSGYNSAVAGESYPEQSLFAPPMQLLSVGSGVATTITDYFDIRQSDLSDAGTTTNNGQFEPGSSINWADGLFNGADGWSESSPSTGVEPYIATAEAQALILDSGVVPNYVNEGEFS